MDLDVMLDVREPELKPADRAHGGLFGRRYATSAGRLTQDDLTAIVCGRLRALRDENGKALDATLISAAVEQSWSGLLTSRSGLDAHSGADARAVLAIAATPQTLCRLFTNIGTIYGELALGQQALMAYRQALHYSLQTDDPVLIGATRGQLTRLAIQLQQ